MRKGDFISIIQNPSILKGEDIPAIKSILNEFPYFSTAHALLAKAYYDEEHIGFQTQLRKAAANSLDRRRLHELLYGDIALATKEEGIAEVKKIELKPIEEVEVVVAEVEEKEEVDKTQEKTARDTREKDLLELQILSSAISNSIILEVSELDGEEITEEVVDFNLKEEDEVETFNESSVHSFSDWLGHFSDDSLQEEKPKSSLWKESSKLSEQAQRDFGISAPQKKQEFYSALKMAKLSVQEDDDLVTETLAKIYADQENYEKAIKAYKKLQLKYPEKKVYFASQINALKNNLK